MRSRGIRRTMLALAGVMFMAGVVGNSHAGLFGKEEAPGQRFEKAMKRLADNCAKAKLRPGETGCDLLKLKPADPLATEEGRFVHSIKIPNSVPEDSGYKPGMTPQQYFDHLCKTEAGEFIYKTVENVEGLYMMRPRKEATDYELEHLYALEDPYGYTYGEATGIEFLLVKPTRYDFLEMPPSTSRQLRWSKQSLNPSYFDVPASGSKLERYSGYDARQTKTMNKEFDAELKSRYGFTWRGVRRPHDREMGIAGGELIVLDIQTHEVLGFRRGYILSGGMRNLTGIWWMTGRTCPTYNYRHRNKDFDFSYWFIGKVLKSKHHQESFKELTDGD